MPLIYAFDHRHRKPPMELKDLLGGKGANLAEMSSVLELPVPPGFTITTAACVTYMDEGWPPGLDQEVERHLAKLEKKMGSVLGDTEDPLLLSVRSGAKFSMPGMMDTVLNLGLNDRTVRAFAKANDDEGFAYRSYARLLSMYGRVVLGASAEPFDEALDEARVAAGVDDEAALGADAWKALCKQYKATIRSATGKPFPQDPHVQLRAAIEAVFRSWNGARAIAYREQEGIDHRLGTAVNVQAMVFGNRDDRSGTGVAFTRNAATGENVPYGDFLLNAQGEDVVAGVRITKPLDALADDFPDLHAELLGHMHELEAHYRDMLDLEFTIDQGKLWMLQVRVGKRTGPAALRMAVEMTTDRHIKLTRAEAVGRVKPDQLDQVLHPRLVDHDHTVVAKGLAASPGAAVGVVVFSADDAVERARSGDSVILVRKETNPDDVHGMLAATGLLTTRGGLVSHAAVVARGWGKPAVVGADAVKIHGRSFTVGDVTVEEGDTISIDGTSGEVALGAATLTAPEPSPEFDTLLSWADALRRGKLAVRANADNAEDAANALRFGAEGIGLCRTEHMFLRADRLPIVQQMILADTDEDEAAALDELRRVQHQDFVEILEVMDGLPVLVRLLDPPLHEFLPHVEDLDLKEAAGTLTDEEKRLRAAAEDWAEANPMLGIRGVRLAVMKPGLYGMQVRALLDAVRDRVQAGGKPIVEVMIPLTVSREEMELARSWVIAAAEELGVTSTLLIGTMIETPRAAVVADQLARVSDFFSFGTNDLTQMTFGFSRDDVEAKMMPRYVQQGLLPGDPFASIDTDGVGALVRIAVEKARAVKRRLPIGVCGEHGGDPDSIAFFRSAGLDYVSCSPFRVPVARLAAAQACIADG
ncbi:pyruvate, phosphate dikinase [Iamia sp. SCSIO 61187]|uniref:pyruvate, phosphate dikinase n=1 Tax=Iamia sp. SCSIO 61187 TaxID=2722752 RepID=UPI001C63938B|nr:pyruvate, phosphate dikinase [Iamia sp. SCSIO 61187]QYG94914.1 pyruvate, phosphate dikinase [Iamia sp. SCSIO 61187]